MIEICQLIRDMEDEIYDSPNDDVADTKGENQA